MLLVRPKDQPMGGPSRSAQQYYRNDDRCYTSFMRQHRNSPDRSSLFSHDLINHVRLEGGCRLVVTASRLVKSALELDQFRQLCLT